MIQKINPYNQDNKIIVKINRLSFDDNISKILSRPLHKILNINEGIKGININPKKKIILLQHSEFFTE